MRSPLWSLLLLLPLVACSGTSTPAAPPPSSSASTAPATEPPTSPVTTPTTAPAATVGPTTTPTPVDSAPPLGAPACKAADLTVTDADSVVTQQYREQVYVIRTTGPDCGLQGTPTVSLRGADGKALSVTYSHGGYGQPADPAAPLSLSKGTTVSFAVSSPRTGTCATAASLSVTLPATPGSLTAATTARICKAVAGVSPLRRLNADG